MSAASEDLRQLWQRQALDAPRINLTYIRHRTDALRRRIQIRNAFEYLGGIVAIVLMLSRWSFIRSRPLTAAAVLLWVLVTIYFMVRHYRRASAQAPAEQLGTLDALQFYRQQLVRQRDARQGIWRRLFLPLAPVLVLTFIALIVEMQPVPWMKISLFAAWVVIGSILGMVNNEKVIRGYQQEIDALDSMSAKT